MDVNADVQVACARSTHPRERFFIQRETGMRADQSRKLAVRSLLDKRECTVRFRQVPRRPRPADCDRSPHSTSHAAQPNRRDAIFERRQTSIDRLRRSMMIDERRRAAAHRRERPNHATRSHAFERMRPIQSPPDELQNLMKVGRRLRRRRHPGRERRIQMRMPIDQPRHQHRAAAINGFILRLGSNALRRPQQFAHPSCRKSPALDHRRIKLHEHRIAKDSSHATTSFDRIHRICRIDRIKNQVEVLQPFTNPRESCRSCYPVYKELSTPVRSLSAVISRSHSSTWENISVQKSASHSSIQVLDRPLLLLDPREILQIVNRLAVGIRQLAEMIVGDRFEIAAKAPSRRRAVVRPTPCSLLFRAGCRTAASNRSGR